MVLLAAMLLVTGSSCIYLSSPKQLWCRQPLPAFGRYLGSVLLMGSFILLWLPYQPVVAVAVWLTGTMCALVVLPYSGAALQLRRRRTHG
ncbi:hypothetical protein [Ketobacter sp.]|uniref:hypothetical protein n=1 Tax=Ketobacter sp. TaxID=2083498 RepID=UPI000F0E1270|nr:hypothetical protein [Ketobacter sp.]RLU01574.1 MAG: hypothetical protein D9N14_02070 [Ketobacter sp.]